MKPYVPQSLPLNMPRLRKIQAALVMQSGTNWHCFDGFLCHDSLSVSTRLQAHTPLFSLASWYVIPGENSGIAVAQTVLIMPRRFATLTLPYRVVRFPSQPI